MGRLIMLSVLLIPMALTVPAGALPAGHAAAPERIAVEQTRADTVVTLRRGDRVVFENLEGEITIRGWGRDEMEIRGTDGDARIVVQRSGSTVRLAPDGRKGRDRSVEATVRLPAWVDLVANGRSLDLDIEGVGGRVDVRTVRGEVAVRDAEGPVSVRTVSGEIDVTRARGGVDLSSQSDDVTLRDATGTVVVSSLSGDLTLTDVRSRSVSAETQDGDIRFSGTVEDDGDYRFYVHDGDAVIAIPASTNARVAVSTFDGEFESDFPVLIQRFSGGREFDFTIGEPRARIEIQVFDGEIRLVRR